MAWSVSSCVIRRGSGESGVSRACWATRHYSVVAMVGVQRLARLLRATAADSTADHGAVAMPRRPWCAVAAGEGSVGVFVAHAGG